MINVALLGTWHVHAKDYTKDILDDPRANLAAVWDADAEKGQAFADQYGVPYVADLDAVLADENIDAVCVTVATNEHVELIKKVAAAKKHIFTEKVLAFTVKEAEELKAAIDASGVKFTISYPHRTWGKLQYAKKMVEDGVFGQITYARVRNVHEGAVAGWLPPHFYDKNQCGGGAMMDLGAHPMYTLAWLLGEPVAINSTFTTATGKPVEDNAVSVIEFKNGTIGVSETGFVSIRVYALEINGSEAGLMIHDNLVRYWSKETDGKWVEADVPENQKLPLHQWVDAICDGTDAPFTTEEAVMLTKLMEGAYIASDSNSTYRF